MLSGVEKTLLLKKKCRCGECEGSRCLRGTVPTRCWTCYGKGVQVLKNGPYLQQDPCVKCHGSGMTIKHRCPNCFGQGLILSEGPERIKIPALVGHGQVLKFEHRGHASANSYAGTLHLTVNVREHAHFRRVEGLDLESSYDISYATGVLGGAVEVQTLSGPVTVTLQANFEHGRQLVFEKGGLFDPKTGKMGKHVVKFFFKSPIALSEEENKLYEVLGRINN